MSDPVTNQVNSLSYLIPTGALDVAIQQVLVPIFGSAVACKIPGSASAAACSTTGGMENAASNSGLVEAIFSVFNAGTLVFATILLIFIALIGFIKTANDGEFFGRSWNTTFSALRLVAGIAFILPMPNNMSSIQNFTLYVGLWGSGFANQMSTAVSEHYLTRLQRNMVLAEPNASSLNSEAKNVLLMHICASLAQQQFGGAKGADLRMTTTASSVQAATGIGPTSSVEDIPVGTFDYIPGVMGGPTLSTRPYTSNRVEYAYVERGTFFKPQGTAPCGRAVLDASVDPAREVRVLSSVPTDAYGNGSDPLTKKTRDLITKELGDFAANSRAAKVGLVSGMLNENGSMRELADRLVVSFAALGIQYNQDGSVSAAGATKMPDQKAKEFISSYTGIVKNANDSLLQNLTAFRRQKMDDTKGSGSGGSAGFFPAMKTLLQEGGWMASASTYRTMLDMTSLQFNSEAQNPFQLTGINELTQSLSTSGAGGFSEQHAEVKSLAESLLGSDTARTAATNANMTPSNSLAAEAPSASSITALGSDGAGSIEKIAGIIYGDNFFNRYRVRFISALAVSPDYDPLYQVKALGDSITTLSGTIMVSEVTVRFLLGTAKAFNIAKDKSIVGAAVNTIGGGITTGAIAAAEYILDSVFGTMKLIAIALTPLGYTLSTYIPAIPFIAFLLASLGWLFGLVMTLFAMNLWGVMHITPAQNDSFIGSETQGYLLLLALFFRPAIAVAALSLSFIVAPPIMKLINITLLPMMMATGSSTGLFNFLYQLIFGLVLYMVIVQGALLMIFMTPQSFPDEVMRIISAGIGDLGQGKAMGQMEAGDGFGRGSVNAVGSLSEASAGKFKGVVRRQKEANEKNLKDAKDKEDASKLSSNPTPVMAKQM